MVASLVPVVEMLWEPGDARAALSGRFGFRSGESAARWVAELLDEHWGVRVDSCERIVMSGGNALAWVGTPGGRMLAKWSVAPARFARLAEVARVTSWLRGREVPVSAPVPARDGRLQVEVDGVSVGLQHEIAGDLLDISHPVLVRAAGATVARLQAALAVYPYAEKLGKITAVRKGLGERVVGWLDGSAGHLPVEARDTLRARVAAAPPDRLAGQLVHFDFRSANVLCAGDEVAAVLDFEEARHDHRLVELARAAVLLGTRYHDWGPVSAEVRAEFFAGYESVCPLTADEAAWLDILVRWQALMMVPRGDDPTGWGASALG
ncbi:phosphotransferase [Actinoplanes palleronii]|uniref:Homoserine kinase type II (Protein kinase fold) n=1 Tax=Actinoplanes palleronii TaxID=113570 RepID=A0ABQ4BT69_9ACTN|nr:phosphotransferase [Actinoplanes palleronii]GIE73872.1 homoserine kinase type II (protein kinase fold) [Actinoplanes palleronii]